MKTRLKIVLGNTMSQDDFNKVLSMVKRSDKAKSQKLAKNQKRHVKFMGGLFATSQQGLFGYAAREFKQ